MSFFLIKFCKLEKSRNFFHLSSIYLYRDGSDIPKNYFIHLDILIFFLSMGVAFVNIWAFISISILFYVFFSYKFQYTFCNIYPRFLSCLFLLSGFFFYCVCVLGLLLHFYVYILISLMDLCICFFYYLSWHLVCWCYVVF